jgi:hypothetical protein
LDFAGVFPRSVLDSDFSYKQNYIGTLREVLQQWCSDLGYDFYCSGKQFIGLNINQPVDIKKVTDIADPTSELGQNFALNTNTAILTYRESNTIANSYRQSIITANTVPRQTKSHSKTPKRYVGLLPLHPIDFNYPSRAQVNRYDLFGNIYPDRAWANSFEVGADELGYTLDSLDGRTYADVDTAIALTHYDTDLRDIYCQQQAIYGLSPEIRASNFRALGMVPLIEITNAFDKSSAIQAAYSSLAGDETSNICLDQRYFKVYIGYYYSKYKEDILSWEQAAANSMYKYGAITKGLVMGLPYVPSNVLQDLSPSAGLYGSNGASTMKITHNYTPSCQQYFDLYNAPFKDIILHSGLKNRSNYISEYLNIGELSNDWGTTTEQFKRELSLRLDDACVDEFGQSPSYTNIENSVHKTYQDWKFAMFKPQANPNLEQFFTQYLPYLKKIDPSQTDRLDRHVQTYYDMNYQQANTCSKLHIMVLTDTLTHPNILVNFARRSREFVNPVVLQKYREQQEEAAKRKAMERTPNLCDKTLLQEMCDGLIVTSGSQYGDNPRFSCSTEEEAEAFEEGFDAAYLSSPNSRGLDIQIIKNPVRNDDTDALQKIYRGADSRGAFYYLDTIAGFNSYQQKQANFTIIYPVSAGANDNIHYKGILSSSVEVENRSPEMVEIFGEPANFANNTAAGIKVINNVVDPDLQPQLDPISSKFVSYLTMTTEDNQVIKTVSQYHDIVKKLNNYEITGASKSVELTLAGTPDFFGTFRTYLSPSYGMNKMSIGVTDNGVVTSLSYADRPPTQPKQESILNKIGPRIKK